MALTASDYIVLNGLGIANSWAQNRMARLSLEQRQKEQADEDQRRKDEMKQRAEENRLDRENRMAVADKTIEREDVRQGAMMDRFEKSQESQKRAAWDRMVRDEEKQLLDIDAKAQLEKDREEAKLKIEQMKLAKDGLTSVGAGIGRLLGYKDKNQIAAEAEERKGLTQRNAEVFSVYKLMPPEERTGWKLNKNPDGSYSLDPKEEASTAPLPSEQKPIEKQLPSGLKFRYWPSSGFMPPTK
jgi:hypothetical protein